MIKLHLGCGKRFIAGFIHIDLATYSHIDYKHDVQTLPMFEDDAVDLIYASHVIEYFDRDEAVEVLGEWRRVLKKGGKLRLAVPDFKALAIAYNKYKNLDLICGPLYGRWEISGTDKIVYHKTVYDYSSLKTALEKAGFVNVKKWDWREVFVGKLREFDDYSQAYVPHADKKSGILISLNIEAEKG